MDSWNRSRAARAGVWLLLAAAPALCWAHSSAGPPPDADPRGMPPPPPDPGAFVNFESPHVHPIDLSPDGSRLAVCNTPDGRVEIYSVHASTGLLTHLDSIPVGYDPVSVRFRNNSELWAVNRISDSVIVVNLAAGIVTATIDTADEPADVVFYLDTGSAEPLAAVSCSRENLIQVFHAGARLLVNELPLKSQDPRALATDGTFVFVAAFASGNGTTLLASKPVFANALDDPDGPYAGQNPPFNNGIPGTAWVTPLGSDNFATIFAPPPQVGLIVRKDSGGVWRDDNGADWTDWISGAKSDLTRRVPGWDLTDNDVAKFSTHDTASALAAGFGTGGWVRRRMTNCMALARNPVTGAILLVGTEATNEIRFEPKLTGTFTRVLAAINHGTTGANIALADLNQAHLAAAQGGSAYQDGRVPQSERNKSIGDPRGVAFNPAGTRAYVTGMGSGNVVVIDAATGARLGGPGYTIDLGSPTPGPTGIVHHASLNRAYVVTRFASTVITIDTANLGAETVLQTLAFYDPTPAYINDGRDDLYDTHQNSGLGQIACASCHIDARNDRLAWDLGNPQGGITPSSQVNPANPAPGQHNRLLDGVIDPYNNFHDMKGPMTTQTLVDIIGKEPHHWRGDRDGIEEFAAAFVGLQGDNAPPTTFSMQQFEDFLSSLHFPPNPHRALDNSLPGGSRLVGLGNNPDLPLDGYYSNGPTTENPGLSPRGTPLPDGNAFRGFQLFVEGNPLHVNPTPGHDSIPALDGRFQCVSCHALPTGAGPLQFAQFNNGTSLFDFVPIAPGPNGERHSALISIDAAPGPLAVGNQGAFKIPQLRNQLDKHGLNYKIANASTLGFGLFHDGRVDDLDTLMGSNVFDVDSDQDVADLVAFSLCVNGGGFDDLAALPGAPDFLSPPEFPINLATVGQLGPDGGVSQSAQAATGKQITITSPSPPAAAQARIDLLVALAQANRVDLIARGMKDGARRGWYLFSGATFHSDSSAESISLVGLMALASANTPLTFTAVPEALGIRTGVDRDEDGGRDRDEAVSGSDPANPDDTAFVGTSIPPTVNALNTSTTVSGGLALVTATPGRRAVLHIQGGDYAGAITVTKPVVLRKMVDPATGTGVGGLVRIGT